MAERIDMSLDDIIKRDRIRSSGTRRGGIANKLGNRKAGGGGRPSRSLPVRKIGAVSRKMKTGVRRNSNNAVNKVVKIVLVICEKFYQLFSYITAR